MGKNSDEDGQGMPLDPWAFQRWAFEQTTGVPARKSVLMTLAVMVDTNTGRCEARQGTLAQHTELKDRTVREHLVALEEGGFIARRHQYRADGKRRADQFLLLAPGITEWPDGTPLERTTGESRQSSLPATERCDYRRPVAAQERPPVNNPKQRKPPTATAKELTTPIELIWERYDEKVLKPNRMRRRLDDTARRMIKLALQLRELPTVLAAVDGLAVSAHHNGKNESRKKYLDLRYALRGNSRNGETPEQRIDAMAELAQSGAPAREPLRKQSDAWTGDQL